MNYCQENQVLKLYTWQKDGLTVPFFLKQKKNEALRKLFSESYKESYENLVLLSPTFILGDISNTQQ